MLEEQVPARGRRPLRSWVLKLGWLVVPLALVGEAGHQLLGRLGQTLAHHFFHIVFGLGAVAVFFVYVAIDIRRHGWPTFSWRIRPENDPS
jgi:hypothetical protein